MAIIKLIDATDPKLLIKSETVEDVTGVLTLQIINDLIDTLMDVGGVGLAAPQIGVNKQIFVYRLSPGATPKIIINPRVVVSSGKVISRNEGCLSVPGCREDITRYKTFVIEYSDYITGEKKRIRPLVRLETLILQHEYDHLMGVLINNRRK